MSFINSNGLKISFEIIDECEDDYLLLHTGLNHPQAMMEKEKVLPRVIAYLKEHSSTKE